MKKSKHILFFAVSMIISLFGAFFPEKFAHPLTFFVIVLILAIYLLIRRSELTSETSDNPK